MTTRLAPAAASAVGLFLAVAAIAAAILHAPLPAVVFGGLAVLHLAVAVGSASGSRLAAGLGVVAGTVTIALVAAGLVFIAGIEAGVGLDLSVAWFAPLNGYATIAIATALIAASLVLVVAGIRGVRRVSIET